MTEENKNLVTIATMSPKQQFALGFEAGWYAAIDAALKETELLTGDKGTASSGLSRTFRTMAKLKKLRERRHG
jgi:hypothetical protein